MNSHIWATYSTVNSYLENFFEAFSRRSLAFSAVAPSVAGPMRIETESVKVPFQNFWQGPTEIPTGDNFAAPLESLWGIAAGFESGAKRL